MIRWIRSTLAAKSSKILAFVRTGRVCLYWGLISGILWSSVLVSPALCDRARQDETGSGEPISHERLVELMEQLGSEKYAERRLAEKVLLRIGTDAFDILQQALDHDDLEIAARAQYLIRKIEIRWTRPGDSRAARTFLRAYSVASEQQRGLLMKRLASLPGDEGLDGLCRIARFEKSSQLSCEAALLIIRGPSHRSAQRENRPESIRSELGMSVRPAAKWLQAYLRMFEEPKDSVPRWDALFQEEKERLAKDAGDWKLLAQLMYTVASAYQQRDAEEISSRIADEAFALASDDAEGHLLVADTLAHHGLFKWAEREYRQVLQMGPAMQSGFGFLSPQEIAASSLSSMFYEQSEELEAARVLESFYKAPVGNSTQARNIHASKEFYFAAHYAKHKDWKKHREHLENAVKIDPMHADVLIAMYRFPEADEAFKKRTKELIKKADEAIYRRTRNDPDDPFAFNHWAWLIGNTEGDYKKAIQLSHRSISLARRDPNRAGRVSGYMDTLGRCYYANGDYVNAVKWQQQAVDMDPHSKLLTRQLDLFKKALSEEEAKKSKAEAEAKTE